jgi:spore germination protein
MRLWVWKGRAVLANRNGEEHGSITPYQLTTIITGGSVGVGVLALPRMIVEQAGTGAPLAVLLGAVPAFVAWLCYVKLSKWYPGRTPSEYVMPILTKPIGWVYLFGMGSFKVLITALGVREFGEVVKTAVLPNTPIEVTITILLLVIAYFVRYDVQVFARVYEVFFPIMLMPLTVIGLLSLTNARLSYLLPLTGTSWKGVLSGAMLATLGYVAAMVSPFMLPSLNQSKYAVKAGLIGFSLALFVYFMVVTNTLAVFGPEEIKQMLWPTFELVKTTTVPGFILERLEPAFVGIWVAAVFTTTAATYYPLLLMLTQAFRLKDHKVMAIPLIPIFYMIAMAPGDIHTLYRIVTIVGLFGVVVNQVVPLPMVMVAYLRGKGATSRAGQAQ